MALRDLTRHRTVLGLAILVITGLFLFTAGRLLAAPHVGLVPGCDTSAQEAQAISAAVAAAIRQTPELASDPQNVWRVHSVCQQGTWAYAFVKGYVDATGAPISAPSLVALVRQSGTGWQAVLPQNANEYSQELAAVPATLLDGTAKALLGQPAPGAGPAVSSAAGANFSGFALPFAGGQSAYVLKHWYPAIDFSIGDPSPGDAIRNAKAGIAVFVKGSSTVQCGDPPPNWTCWMFANAIVIQSGPNEYAWYMHLLPDSIPDWLQEGAFVPAGADIGQEGMTGWASLPHLHFMVSTSYACCEGQGDGRFPAWPYYATFPVDFNEYGWYDLPYQAESQNGSPPAVEATTAAEASGPQPAAPPEAPPEAPPAATDPPPAPTPEPAVSLCPNPYVVQSGDWLNRIASNCNIEEAALVAANPGLNPNLIYAGQSLNMPVSLGGRPGADASALPPVDAPTEAAAPAGGCTGTHVILPGESLFQIGAACGLTWQQMATANGIGYPYTIYAGQTLHYP